jgi:hypothetical protein
MGAVASEAAIAHPTPAIAALERAEAAFDLGADRRKRTVHPALPGRERTPRMAAVHDAIGDAGFGQRLAAGGAVVSWTPPITGV